MSKIVKVVFVLMLLIGIVSICITFRETVLQRNYVVVGEEDDE